MRLIPKGQSDDVDQQLEELAREVNVNIYSFVELIAELQEEVSKFFIQEYGMNSSIDLSSLPKLARIMSKYAASDNFQKLRKYPKNVQKHFNTWQLLRKDALNSSKSRRKLFAAIPSKLCFYYFYNGELCKAVVCLLDYVDLMPEDTLSQDAALRWLMFIGETELADRKMNKWKMESSSEEIWNATRLAINFAKIKETRVETLEKIMAIREKIKTDNVKSFPKYELATYVSWLCSTLSNVQVGVTLEDCVFPDRLSQLQEAAGKADAIMRNRIPGLAAYQFDNAVSTSIWPFLEEKRPGTPTEYIHLGSTVAWYFEIRREWALLNVTTAQGRDSLSAMMLNLRSSIKSASVFRILQAANNMTYYSIVIEEPTSAQNTKLLKASIINLISSDPIIVHCSTPIKNQAPSRAHTPLPGQKSTNNSTIVDDVVDKFGDLELLNEQPFHPITRSCGCNICLQYPFSSTFAAEYMFAYCIYSDFSQIAMQHFDKEFVSIRERDMKCQAYMFRDQSVRPRPNVIQCEIFGLCAIQWMIRKIDAKEPVDEESLRICKNALKIARYLHSRTIDQCLALQQLERQYEFPQDKNFSWMHPVVRKPLVKAGIECAVDIFRAVSPFGRRPKIPVVKDESPVDTARLEKMKMELRMEYKRYTHILYRDWRCRMFPYIGRTFENPWEAAYAWAESTLIGSRNAVQSRLERCRKGLVTISGPERFRTCVENVPDDMTIVSLAMADNKQIYLIKLHADRDPIIMPIAHNSQAMELMDKFTFLLMEDERVAKAPGDMSASEFWERRKIVDARLAAFVGEVQKSFLDVSASLLMPSGRLGPAANDLAWKISELSKGGLLIGEAKEMVYLSQFTESKPWCKLIYRFCEMRIPFDAKFCDSVSVYHQCSLEALEKDRKDGVKEENTNKKYTYLVICPQLSQFCWERLPIFEHFPYVVRQVSIHSIFSQLEAMRDKDKKIPLQIDVQNAYYVLDPENNLGDTKRRMLDYVNKFNWDGTVGSAPKSSEIGTVLAEYDAFFYFGHGSGSSVMPRSVIKQSTCNAISLLMGCGSVRTVPQAHGFDGKSALLDYTMAKCPLIVGCLWTVTDGEIDRFLMRMIDDCFDRTREVEGVEKLRQLAEAMHESRLQSKLKYLTGAAVVMYGFPVVAKSKAEKEREEREKQEAKKKAEEEAKTVNQPVSEEAPPKPVVETAPKTQISPVNSENILKPQKTVPIVPKVVTPEKVLPLARKPAVPKTPPRTPRSAAPKTPRATRSTKKATVFNDEEEDVPVPSSTRVLRSSNRTPSRNRPK